MEPIRIAAVFGGRSDPLVLAAHGRLQLVVLLAEFGDHLFRVHSRGAPMFAPPLPHIVEPGLAPRLGIHRIDCIGLLRRFWTRPQSAARAPAPPPTLVQLPHTVSSRIASSQRCEYDERLWQQLDTLPVHRRYSCCSGGFFESSFHRFEQNIIPKQYGVVRSREHHRNLPLSETDTHQRAFPQSAVTTPSWSLNGSGYAVGASHISVRLLTG